jgi:eukaryotic-like serine/threonine-protein kinase
MSLAAGTRLGPYEVLGLVGAGGMGEVYRARDPRLGREVAVKVLPSLLASDPERLARFEREARAVAALNHPNILTVFDVGTQAPDDGAAIPYVVTELLEGETLRETVSRRAPSQRQVLAFAVQVAHGLEAAHAKGIVHRDLKPENVFVTTDGRLKVLDFGLAKLVDRQTTDSGEATEASPTGAGQVLGTVGYMSPEQVRGLPVDHRTDVFSLGVVLYELLSGKHPFRRDTTIATLTAILEDTPAELSSVARGVPPALSGIVRTCLEKGREERFHSAHDLARLLEAVLQAPAGAASLQEMEERSPYPGLSSFTEKDAALFFGRGNEIRTLWERLGSRRLLAIIGPSGAGKSSFLRAGVIPARPEGWGALCATPGSSPALGLARALTPEMAGDPEAIGDLLGGVADLIQKGDGDRVVSAAKRWRVRYGEALLVLDQFEELFTQSPPETQERFAAVLARLGSEADIHVALSLRDDFLMRCHEQPALVPVFTELTPLGALTKEGLRSALVEPAKKRGYRFEDDALVDEMVASVEGARGALPLLAFAVSRLWEKRDREKKLLTRTAYEEIGGVAGALAQHAEATLDRIGDERQGMVREIFRNLVTAQWTRASIDREELLSVFPDRTAAEEVLGALVDARLLTSYEVVSVEGEEERSHHRVEIVHESLLKAWPRLVRWQAQDEDGAVLRDQLKQASHLWQEKGRPADLLWSGTSFKEFELWREHYPGQLTALEEQFARSMAERARRRKRLVRATVAVAFVGLAAVAGVIAVSRQQAVASQRRGEASRLLTLAQLRIKDDPTEALAFTTASLELADSEEARVFATKVLWEAPPAFELPTSASLSPRAPAFSPDGRYLAAAGHSETASVWSDDGKEVARLPGHGMSPLNPNIARWVSPARLVTGGTPLVHVWSIPEARLLRTIDLGSPVNWLHLASSRLLAETWGKDGAGHELTSWRAWDLPDGSPQSLARVDWTAIGEANWMYAPSAQGFLYAKARAIALRSWLSGDGARDRVVGRHEAEIARLGRFEGQPERVWSLDGTGAIRIWSFSESGLELQKELRRPETAPAETFWLEFDGRLAHDAPGGGCRAGSCGCGTRPLCRAPSLSRCGEAAHGTGRASASTRRGTGSRCRRPAGRASPSGRSGGPARRSCRGTRA